MPSTLVAANLLDRELQLRKDIRNTFEKWNGENGHEPNLTGRQLVHVTQFRGTTEQRRLHAHLFLHFALVGELLLQYLGPLFSYIPRPRNVADICAFDQQAAKKRLIHVNVLGLPADDTAVVCVELLLQRTQPFHEFLMHTHIRRQDRADQQLPELFILEGSGPMTTKDLRKGGTVKRFQDGVVVVELRQRGVQFDEEEIVDSRVAYIVSNGGNE